MKRIFCLCLLSLFLISLSNSLVFGQTASDVLQKMIEAQGGRKTLEAIKDTTMSGTFDMPSMGLSGTITMYQKDPDKTRMDAEFMGMVFTQAFDGETGWSVDPQSGGVVELSEKGLEYAKRDALGDDALLHPEKCGITYAYKGKETVEGKDCFVLEATYSDGYKSTIYIDSKTYLTYKTKALSLDMMEVEVDSETTMSDYKKVGGVMVPHTIVIYQGGEEFMTITVTDVSFNTGLEDSLFKMDE
jgi:outer membrane lipoprotein-sorting protein